MPGSFLLDTNIVIALFAGEPSVHDRLAEAELTFLPAMVLGELYYGARKSGHQEANLATVDDLASKSSVLSCDAATAKYYGEIKYFLRSKGRPIPENDIWIASLARQYGLTLISRDEHFSEVEGISVEKW